ncbi:unnamed protein product [Anisakis simplex]|uniref:Solute carrier family 25 member 38 (inferred by orthology to a human protein) n=1 Tax=Anisakis simplex TaxID=6269 RepID=A0A0M3JX42_ANISI|nr:unnamed protein product [Anisakis simplex]
MGAAPPGKDEQSAKTITLAICSSVAFGTVSGFWFYFSSVLLQPLDRLKTLSQQDAVCKTNVFQRTAQVVGEHGVKDLWRGIVPTLLRIVPGVAVYFGCLEVGRDLFPKSKNENVNNFLLGAISRSVAVMLLMPATVIKTRFEKVLFCSLFQSSYYRDSSVSSAASNIIKQGGVRGLFKGIVPTLMRDAPFSGLYLLFYRQHLKLLSGRGSFDSILLYILHSLPKIFLVCLLRLNDCCLEKHAHKPVTRFGSGILAGLMACAVTQPFDITKTHVQLYPLKYRSMFHVASHLYSRGGLVAFFNGFWLRATRRTLMSALNWTLFDELFASRVHDD